MSATDVTQAANLADDTAVKPLLSTPGLYTADLPEHWNVLGPSGGVLMTIALRAMNAQLNDNGLRVLSATSIFCGPVHHGPLSVRVEILRASGSAAHARASLTSLARPGPGMELTATFARARTGPDIEGATFPDVPGPEQNADVSRQMRQPLPTIRPMPFFDHVESCLALGGPWWDEAEDRDAMPPRCARWFRYLVPQRDARGRVDILAIPPLADTMAPAIWQALEGGKPAFYAPGLDLTLHFIDEPKSEWLLSSAYARRAHHGFASVEVEIWSLDRKLVAYGTQTMLLRPMQRGSTKRESKS